MAFNREVAAARGEMFLTLGSDHAYLPQAQERSQHHWRDIPPKIRQKLVGVSVPCRRRSWI
ncbi:hypothetical protein DFAR_1670003 [Desulfarculales bacterium]